MLGIHPKVTAATSGATFGGAIATVLVWALNRYCDANIPAEIAGALGTIFSGAFGFLAGYLRADAPTA